MATELMLDLETLATDQKAIVLQIGMLLFDPETERLVQIFDIYPPIRQQTIARRTLDLSTVSWWLSDSDRAQQLRTLITAADAANEQEKHRCCRIADAFSEMRTTKNKKPTVIWTNGQFDWPIFKSLMADCFSDVEIPWSYRDVCDLRTMKTVACLPREFAGTSSHNAVDDCLKQIAELAECRRRLSQCR